MLSNFSSSFHSPLIEVQSRVAVTNYNIIGRSLAQKERLYSGSLTRHFELLQRRPCVHVSGLVVLGLAMSGSQILQVPNEKKKAGNLMRGDDDDEISLVLAAASSHCGEEGSAVAGLSSASKVPTSTTETLLAAGGSTPTAKAAFQTSNTDKSLRTEHDHGVDAVSTSSEISMQAQKEQRMLRKRTQQRTYLFAAVASSLGITSLAGASVYCRFAWQMQGGEVPWTEMCGTFSLALGAAVGMEYWARWAHRALWHASFWSMHESHHRPRDGPFELNDVFAIINAVPAIALMAFGFLNKGLVSGLCFGAGLGITMFGIAYMFVHDGLVHRRFPVGPIADVPYFQKVAAAHQLHHANKYNGVPYGLFLGPMELAEVGGGQTELEKLVQKRKRESKNPVNS